MKRSLRGIKEATLIVVGILSAGLGLKGFLLASRLIDGGVTGISMLLAQAFGWPLAWLLLGINLPFIALGYRQIGKKFAIKSTLAIGGLALALALIHFPTITSDKLLTAVFGGLCIGAGIGLAMRGGAVLDGTEVAALLISRHTHLLKVGDVILLFNVVIFAAAAVLLGTESALYSILTYLAASKTVDFLVYGIEEYHGVMIVSTQSEVIRQAILHDLRRGVTVYQGRGGLSETTQDILYCVVTRLEIGPLKSIVNEHDETAFIVVHHVADVSGGVIKPRLLH